jgi:hypothetical protein
MILIYPFEILLFLVLNTLPKEILLKWQRGLTSRIGNLVDTGHVRLMTIERVRERIYIAYQQREKE